MNVTLSTITALFSMDNSIDYKISNTFGEETFTVYVPDENSIDFNYMIVVYVNGKEVDHIKNIPTWNNVMIQIYEYLNGSAA
jgi:hypothetical protein